MLKPVVIYRLSILFILSLFSFCFAQEQITITTYYPSPFGSYRELTWGNLPNSRGFLRADQGSSIELGGPGNTPYIDFSNDMTSNFDARVILVGDNRLAIDGVSVASFDARLSPGSIPAYVASRAHIPGCIRYTFTATSDTQQCPVGYRVASGGTPYNSVGSPTTSGNFLCCQTQ